MKLENYKLRFEINTTSKAIIYRSVLLGASQVDVVGSPQRPKQDCAHKCLTNRPTRGASVLF